MSAQAKQAAKDAREAQQARQVKRGEDNLRSFFRSDETVEGSPALHAAVERNHEAAVNLLLVYGAHIDAIGMWSMTPLHVAAEKGHRAMIQRLLLAKPNTSALNNRGRTPLHMAIRAGHVNSALDLCEAGTNVKTLDCVGYSPLHDAAQLGLKVVVRRLLEHGAETNPRTRCSRARVLCLPLSIHATCH